MPRQFALFCVAVQFLTRLPVPTLSGFRPDWTSRSTRYFPLVGALVGILCALVFWIASEIWTGPIPAVLTAAAGALITGAFHEDGLADTFDGLGGGQSRDHRLEIMKDSRIGTFGALGLGLTLALKIAALAVLPVWLGATALIAAHAGGRAAAVIVMRTVSYGGDRDRMKVKPVAQGVTRAETMIGLVFAVAASAPLVIASPVAAVVAIAGGGGLAILMAATAKRLIGGWVGDTLGATEQMFELGVLLALAGALAFA